MKLTDALAKVLKLNKIKDVFGLQGGAVVHIFDSIEKIGINVTYTHHEESAALAAVANAKIENNIGCVVVTTGPASTNAITGLLAAWQESVPCIFISGQSRSNHTSYGKKVRQVGTQEVNICDIVKPLTKKTIFIKHKKDFLKEFYNAIKIAKEGRQGPVWIDLPLDLQWAEINFTTERKINIKKNLISKNKKNKLFKLIKNSIKPILILGYGMRSSKDLINKVDRFTKKKNIPYVTTWNGADFFPSSDSLNLGIIGMSGQRGANKAIFNSDLIICLGTHLSIPHTTTLYDTYALNAKKIIVNIDKDQLDNLNLKFDLKIKADLNDFLILLLKLPIKRKKICKKLLSYKEMNWYLPKSNNSKPNSDIFIKKITKKLFRKSIIVDGGGTALYAGFQSSEIYKNDRLICSSSISSMGTGLAETIGVSKNKKYKNLLCIIGDGSFLMNIQDLQTIFQYKLNVIILVVNNNGYLAIRNTQKEFLNKRYFGTHPDWNLQMPNISKLSKAFGINYIKVSNSKNLEKKIDKIIKLKRPLICELVVDENQHSLFKQGYLKVSKNKFSPQPLSEMYPFLEQPIANTNN